MRCHHQRNQRINEQDNIEIYPSVFEKGVWPKLVYAGICLVYAIETQPFSFKESNIAQSRKIYSTSDSFELFCHENTLIM